MKKNLLNKKQSKIVNVIVTVIIFAFIALWTVGAVLSLSSSCGLVTAYAADAVVDTFELPLSFVSKDSITADYSYLTAFESLKIQHNRSTNQVQFYFGNENYPEYNNNYNSLYEVRFKNVKSLKSSSSVVKGSVISFPSVKVGSTPTLFRVMDLVGGVATLMSINNFDIKYFDFFDNVTSFNASTNLFYKQYIDYFNNLPSSISGAIRPFEFPTTSFRSLTSVPSSDYYYFKSGPSGYTDSYYFTSMGGSPGTVSMPVTPIRYDKFFNYFSYLKNTVDSSYTAAVFSEPFIFNNTNYLVDLYNQAEHYPSIPSGQSTYCYPLISLTAWPSSDVKCRQITLSTYDFTPTGNLFIGGGARVFYDNTKFPATFNYTFDFDFSKYEGVYDVLTDSSQTWSNYNSSFTFSFTNTNDVLKMSDDATFVYLLADSIDFVELVMDDNYGACLKFTCTSSHSSNKLVDFIQIDYPLITSLTPSVSIQLGANYDRSSWQLGYNEGIKDREQYGNKQYLKGKADGIESANTYSFTGLFTAIFDVPIQTLFGLLNVEILGVNLYSFFTGLLTLALIIFVIKLVI